MASREANIVNPQVTLSPRHLVTVSSLVALFWLALRQHARGRRLLIMAGLFTLPAALLVLVRSFKDSDAPDIIQAALIFNFIPHVLAPLAALLYASGVIQDEVEDQTLTYLLIRPLPRWAIYLTKLLASVLTSSLLVAVGVTVVYVAIFWGTPELWRDVLPARAAKTAGVFALAQVAYCTLFGCISLLTRRSLIAGIAYIIAIEGILANWEFVIRKLTVVYYFRVLSMRWLNPPGTQDWAISLVEAPTAASCVQVLLGAALALTLLGSLLFAQREFGVKTPEAAS
jgi:ABC-2 type transport system permease protein